MRRLTALRGMALALGGLALALASPSACRAEFVVQTEAFDDPQGRLGSFTFNRFDPSLGTLTDVSVQANVTYDYVGTVAENGSRTDTVTTQFAVTDRIVLTIRGERFITMITMIGGGGSPLTTFAPLEAKPIGATNVHDSVDFGLLGQYLQSEREGLFGDRPTFTVSPTDEHIHFTLPGVTTFTARDSPIIQGSHVSITLTYTYTPVVPGPPSLVLAGVGAVVCALWAWVRRRRVGVTGHEPAGG
jgi:hypothetical protein